MEGRRRSAVRRAVTPMVWFVTSNASAVVQRFDSVHLSIKMQGIIRLNKSEDGCSKLLCSPGEHVLGLDDELRQVPQVCGGAQLPHHMREVIQ